MNKKVVKTGDKPVSKYASKKAQLAKASKESIDIKENDTSNEVSPEDMVNVEVNATKVDMSDIPDTNTSVRYLTKDQIIEEFGQAPIPFVLDAEAIDKIDKATDSSFEITDEDIINILNADSVEALPTPSNRPTTSHEVHGKTIEVFDDISISMNNHYDSIKTKTIKSGHSSNTESFRGNKDFSDKLKTALGDVNSNLINKNFNTKPTVNRVSVPKPQPKPRKTHEEKQLNGIPLEAQYYPRPMVEVVLTIRNNSAIKRFTSKAILEYLTEKGIIKDHHKYVDFRWDKFTVKEGNLKKEYSYTEKFFINCYISAFVSFTNMAQKNLDDYLEYAIKSNLATEVDLTEVNKYVIK